MDRLPETPRRGTAPGSPRVIVPSRGLWLTGLVLAAASLSTPRAEEYRPGSSIPTGESANPRAGIIIGPFLFSPSVKVGLSYDDNIFNVEDGFPVFVQSDPNGDGTFTTQVVTQQAESGTIANAEARLALKFPFSHSYVSLLYVPQYRDYTNLTTDRKFYQNVSFETKLNFSSGSSLTIKDDFIDSFFDARRLDGTSVYQLSSTPYRRNDAILDYDWSLAGFWGMAGRLARTNFTADQTTSIGFVDTAHRSASNEYELFDYVTQLIETHGYYNFSRFQAFASGTYANTDQDRTKYNDSLLAIAGCDVPAPGPGCDALLLVPDEANVKEYDLYLGAKGKFTSSTKGEMKLGYSWWRFGNNQTPPYDGFSLLANIDHRFSQRTTGFIRLERAATQATGQFQGYYIREEAFFRLARQLTQQLNLSGGLSYRLSDYPSSVLTECNEAVCDGGVELAPAYKITDYYATIELNYRPGSATRPGPLLLTLQLTPRKTRSDLEASGLDSNGQRASLFIQYGWF
jgi:hypothetical protein